MLVIRIPKHLIYSLFNYLKTYCIHILYLYLLLPLTVVAHMVCQCFRGFFFFLMKLQLWTGISYMILTIFKPSSFILCIDYTQIPHVKPGKNKASWPWCRQLVKHSWCRYLPSCISLLLSLLPIILILCDSKIL